MTQRNPRIVQARYRGIVQRRLLPARPLTQEDQEALGFHLTDRLPENEQPFLVERGKRTARLVLPPE